MKKLLRALTLCATLTAASAAQATPSTTVWAPSTTYTQPFGVLHLTYDTYAWKDTLLPVVTGLTLGVIPGDVVQGEVGFDLLLPYRTFGLDSPLVLNGKLTLAEDKLAPIFPAISVGVANAGITDLTNYGMAYGLVGKTVAGFAVAAGVYYGLDEDLWVDADGDEDRVGLLASVATPMFKLGLPFLDTLGFAADVQTGENAYSAVGAAAILNFFPNVSFLTGPVFFLEPALASVANPDSDVMWTFQLDVDLPFKK